MQPTSPQTLALLPKQEAEIFFFNLFTLSPTYQIEICNLSKVNGYV
jgi:hypothetical protein